MDNFINRNSVDALPIMDLAQAGANILLLSLWDNGNNRTKSIFKNKIWYDYPMFSTNVFPLLVKKYISSNRSERMNRGV